jgi:hypothetical protein
MVKMLFSIVSGVDGHPIALTCTASVLNGAPSRCAYSIPPCQMPSTRLFVAGRLRVLPYSCMRKLKSTAQHRQDQQPTDVSKVLASVLSASPAQIQESRAQAKSGKFSSHSRYKYVPAKRP